MTQVRCSSPIYGWTELAKLVRASSRSLFLARCERRAYTSRTASRLDVLGLCMHWSSVRLFRNILYAAFESSRKKRHPKRTANGNCYDVSAYQCRHADKLVRQTTTGKCRRPFLRFCWLTGRRIPLCRNLNDTLATCTVYVVVCQSGILLDIPLHFGHNNNSESRRVRKRFLKCEKLEGELWFVWAKFFAYEL